MVIFGVVVRLNGVYVFKIMANITVKQKILDALQLFYNKLKQAEIGDLTATGISGNTIADQLSTLNSKMSSFVYESRNIVTDYYASANSSSGFESQTFTKSGYTPIYAAVTGGSYCDWLCINSQALTISGDSVVTGTWYIGNPTSTARSGASVQCRILWYKK